MDSARFDEAIGYLRAGELQRGKVILEGLAVERPDDGSVLLNLGMCYSDLNDLAAAIRTLRRCLEVAPGNADAMTALGAALARDGDFVAAEQWVRQAIGHEPENATALRNFGALLLQKGEAEKALYFFKQALDLAPEDFQAVYGMAQACRKLGDAQKADEFLERVLGMRTPEALKETVRRERTEIAGELLRAGFRTDAMFYCLAALEFYAGKSDAAVRETAFEIAMLGRSGFEVNDPTQRYRLRSMAGTFSGLQMVCFMLVGFKRFAPEQDLMLDLEAEYAAAVRLFQEKKDW